MKILFLNHPEADYGEYFLYNGLCEVAGDENVIDYPYKRSYHGQVHEYPSFYEEHHADYEGDRWKKEGNIVLGRTAPFDWTVPRDTREYVRDEIISMCEKNEFDVIVLGSPRTQSLRSLKELRPHLKTDRVVFHDGEDYNDIRFDILMDIGVHVCLYLKRELISLPYEFGIKPFPFSSVLKPSDPVPKDIDVLCALGATHPNRESVRKVVEELGVKADYERRDWRGYIEAIRRSKIAIAPRGFGRDTVRRWEIPNFDTLMLCERIGLIEDNPLLDGEHCAYYSSPEELREKLRWYLEHEGDRHEVAVKGMNFVREHHTNAARAAKMLQWVREAT